MKEFLANLAIGLCCAGVVVCLAMLGKQYKCDRQWRESNFEAQYQPFAGCRIKMDDGSWVPADNVVVTK